jgi:toxin FitB
LSAGYLLDTSVLSMLAPGRPALAPTLADWLRDRAEALFLSAVTVAEIEQGICKLRRTGGVERGDRLASWLDTLIAGSADRVLPFDSRVARQAGALSDRGLAAGRHPGFADVAIAATASANGLILLTRNGRHFAPLGVALVDPVEGLPAEP